MKKTTMLRRIIKEPGIIVAPGCHDVVSAKLIEKTGFKAIQEGGYRAAASYGLADVGLMTMTEMLRHAKNIVDAVEIPVIADVENGFGNAINAMRMVREFEKAGVAGVHIEDQLTPKRCALFAGERRLASTEEMASKIRAVKNAQKDDDFILIARTDACSAGYGVEEAIKRGKAYAEAGADMILPISRNFEDLKNFAGSWAIDTPLMIIPTFFPSVTVTECEQMGYKMAVWGPHTIYAAVKAIIAFLEELKNFGTSGGFTEKTIKFGFDDFKEIFNDFNELLGLPEIRLLEQKYLPKELRGL